MKVFFLLLTCLFIFPAQGFAAERQSKEWPMHLRFLTGPNGGQWFSMGEPIAAIFSKHVVPTTSRSGGGLANLKAVDQKSGDLAFTLTSFLKAPPEPKDTDDGEKEYLNNTALLANCYPQVLYFLLRKNFAQEHGITTVEQLMESNVPLRFASLRPGTASEFILSLLLKFGYQTNFDEMKKKGWTIVFNNYSEIADKFAEGEIDCFAYTAGTDVPLIKIIETQTDIVILPLDQKILDLMAARFHTTTLTIEKGDYRCATSPINTLGDFTTIAVRKDLPDDLVYTLTKTLWENRKHISDAVEDFSRFSITTAAPDSSLIHPGAKKFWDELKR